jgi:hypothetical protein
MTAAERRALLGDDVIAYIDEQALAAPAPPPELVDRLRRILTQPAGRLIAARAPQRSAA